MQDFSNVSYWTAALIAVAMHEGAHAATATLLQVKVKRVGINWRGPYIVRKTGSVAQNLTITLAGPLMNLALMFFWTRFPTFGMVNLVLAVTNLLPFKGSDGARAFGCLKQLLGTAQVPATGLDLWKVNRAMWVGSTGPEHGPPGPACPDPTQIPADQEF